MIDQNIGELKADDMVLERRNVVVGIRFDGHVGKLLDWAIVKVADPGDRVVALHVSPNSDSVAKDKTLLDTYLHDYDGLCSQKQVDVTGIVSVGTSIRKVLVRETKKLAAVFLLLGTSSHRSWTSIAKYCAKQLPTTTQVISIQNGKIHFRRRSHSHLRVPYDDPKPSLYIDRSSSFQQSDLEMGRFSCEVSMRTNEEIWGRTSVGEKSKEESSRKHKKGSLSLGSISDQDFSATAGWPLLRIATSLNQPPKLSVVQWVLTTLPDRSLLPDTPKSNSDIGMDSTHYYCDDGKEEGASVCYELITDLKLLLEENSSACKWFSYDFLKSSTSNFSSEKLIGKGGRNSVYKALLCDGKPVAVKISKSSEEASKDFRQEVEIMSRVKHKNIAHLLGICVHDSNLLSVYNFLSQGNLEENIHGRSKSVLTWEKRVRIAVGIAEALNYLHNECPRQIIHRDIKSSNILLSEDFEPQLSDFGLAIWGPTKGTFLTQNDVVGTFGYLAPEYFMYGKVSDKIDVYSFGVVLLELLSGRKPIGLETTPRGQESLVMWAKPRLESGLLKDILDESLDVNIEDDQVQRMILAARLCLTQAARLRPNINQILKMLKGEEEGGICDVNNVEEYIDDEVYPDSRASAESHLSLALHDVYDNSTSFSSQSSPLSVNDYLRKRWSRSSSSEY